MSRILKWIITRFDLEVTSGEPVVVFRLGVLTLRYSPTLEEADSVLAWLQRKEEELDAVS